MDWCNDDVDDVNGGGVDYDLSCARADTARASDAVHKAGFRDAFGSAGVDDIAMQAAFDAGYRAAVAPAYAVGILRGIVNILRIAILTPGSQQRSIGTVSDSGSAESLSLSQGVTRVINSLDTLAQISHDSSNGVNNDDNSAVIKSSDKITQGLATSIVDITHLLNDAVQCGHITQELSDAVIARMVIIQ